MLLAGAAAAGWHYREPVRIHVGDRYAGWRFARAFDRAAGDLVGDGNLWLAPVADRPADPRAARHLRAMLALAPGAAASYRSFDRHVVWFVRSGQTAGRRWLAFACVSGAGFEVLAFEREGRGADGRDGVMDTPASRDSGRSPPAPQAIAAEGDAVRVTIDVDGGRNEVLWTLDPGAAGPGLGPGASSYSVPSTVTPLTGWASASQWWPATRGWQLLEGRRASRELTTDGGGAALAFLPDGRIASAGPFRVSLIDVDSDRRERHGLPLDLSPSEGFTFSPDGTRLFVGGYSQAAALVDVLTGKARRYSHSTSGRVMAAFPDNDTLLVIDNVRRARLDWSGLRSEKLDVGPLDGAFAFGAAGRRVAVARKGEAVVIDVQANEDVARFEPVARPQHLSLSPDNRWLAMKGESGLRLTDVEGAKVLWDHQGDDDLHTRHARIKWSADGARGAAAGRKWVYVWSMAEPRWVARLPHGLAGESFDAALSPDGRRLAAGARGSKTIAYWPDLDEALGLSAGAASQPAPADGSPR